MPAKACSLFILQRRQQWRGVNNKQAYVPYLLCRAQQLFQQWLDKLTPDFFQAAAKDLQDTVNLIDLCETGYCLFQSQPLDLASNVTREWEELLVHYAKGNTLERLELRKYSSLLIYSLVQTYQVERFFTLVNQHEHLLLCLSEFFPKDQVLFDKYFLLPKAEEIQQTRSYLTNPIDLHLYVDYLKKNFVSINDAAPLLKQLLCLCADGDLKILTSPQTLNAFLEKAGTTIMLFKLHLALCLIETALDEEVDIELAYDEASLVHLHATLSRYGHSQSTLYLFRHYMSSSHCQALASHYAKLSLLQGSLSSDCEYYLDNLNKQAIIKKHGLWLQNQLRALQEAFQCIKEHSEFSKTILATGHASLFAHALEDILTYSQQYLPESFSLLYAPEEMNFIIHTICLKWKSFKALQSALPMELTPEANQHRDSIETILQDLVTNLAEARTSLSWYFEPYLASLNQINQKLACGYQYGESNEILEEMSEEPLATEHRFGPSQ